MYVTVPAIKRSMEFTDDALTRTKTFPAPTEPGDLTSLLNVNFSNVPYESMCHAAIRDGHDRPPSEAISAAVEMSVSFFIVSMLSAKI